MAEAAQAIGTTASRVVGGKAPVMRVIGQPGPQAYNPPSAEGGLPGSSQSLWAALHTEPVPSFSKLKGHAGEYDVVIVGAGIVGLSSAYVLSDAGYRVALVEASKLASGVTSFSTSKITAQHMAVYAALSAENAKKYAMMNRAGMALMEHAVKTYDIKCNFHHRPHSLYTWSRAIVPLLKREWEAALQAGIEGASFVSDSDLAGTGERPLPSMPASMNIKAALTFPNQIQLNIYSYCIGLVRALQARGVTIFEDSRVLNVTDETPRAVHTADGSVNGQYVILATHLPIMDRSLHWAMCEPTMEYVIAVRLQDGHVVPTDMAINLENPTRSLRAAGDAHDILVIGGNSHSTGNPGVGDQREHYASLEAWARSHFPVKEVVARWMAMDFSPADTHPYMGRLMHGQDTLLTATGFGKWGLSVGSASALVFRDHIRKALQPHSVANRHGPGALPTRGGAGSVSAAVAATGMVGGLPPFLQHTDVWADFFDAARFGLPTSLKGLILENVHTASHFLPDKFKRLLMSKRLEDLQPGEGAICSYKGQSLAAFRPVEGGRPLACKPQCTHLGCDVLWNAADTTWDCPCHGSRFSVEGKVLHAPAVKGLPRVEVDYSW